MEKHKILQKEMIQKEIETTLEGGLISDPQAQNSYIHAKLIQLLNLGLPEFVDKVYQYWNDQKTLDVKIITKQKELQTHIDTYTTNIKEIYEEIKKL